MKRYLHRVPIPPCPTSYQRAVWNEKVFQQPGLITAWWFNSRAQIINWTWRQTAAKAENPPGCAGLAVGWLTSRHAVTSGSSAVSGWLPVGGPRCEHGYSLDRRWQTCWPLGRDWSLCFLTGDLSRMESQEEESRSFIICECNQTYVSAPPRLECQFLEVDILELRSDVYLLYQFSWNIWTPERGRAAARVGGRMEKGGK